MNNRLMTSLLALTIVAGPAMPVATYAAPQDPAALQAPESQAKRPNVLVWMLDDVGFAQLSCFGGLVETPNIDRVAAMGLRYSNYHTAPICSASRAAFLTGRNPHSVHMGGHAGLARPYPGYDAKLPPEDGTVAANMRAAGYTTFALGKWDHVPKPELTPAGPFNRWPTGQGFDRYYGFLAGDTDNWTPTLMRGNLPVAAPDTPDYHLNNDLADQAIAMIHSRASTDPEPPFFMYFATGTAHAPHHAPKEWIDRYKGKFDMGWDKARELILERQIAEGLVPASTRLAPRPEGMAPWDALSPEQKRLYARQMEVFAASLSHADEQFGRILDALEKDGELENTIVVITSDNGASAEGALHGTFNEAYFLNGHFATDEENMAFLDRWGGPETYPHYAFGWAVAGDTPFRYYKQTTHEGGTRVPFVIAWPKEVEARGEVRDQFVYVTDIAPTVMELSGVPLAATVNDVEQTPMEGLSFAYTLDDDDAPDRKQAQYFELFGNKALWSAGWTINTTHRVKSWVLDTSTPPNEPWELYNLHEDPGQTNDLAKQHPEKVAELAQMFDEQAKRYNVYPIGNVGEARPYQIAQRKAEFERRGGKWVFPGPVGHISESSAPPTTLRPFRMTATVEVLTGRETGPIFAEGGALGGIGFYLKEGVPTFILRSLSGEATVVSAGKALPRGANTVTLDFDRKATPPLAIEDGLVTISANGETLVAKTVSFAMPYLFGVGVTFDVGIDYGSALTTDYRAGDPFPGEIQNVVFDFNR